MTRLTTLAAAAVLSAGAFAFTTGSASAAIVCNDIGDCWHVGDTYTYPAEARVVGLEMVPAAPAVPFGAT